MFRIATKLAFRRAGIYRYPPHVHYACRASSTQTQKKQTTNPKHHTAYSKVSMLETEKRLGFKLANFEKLAIPVSQMLEEAKPVIKDLRNERVQQTKEMVFENIVRCIEGEGYPTKLHEDYPTESHPDFTGANLNDLVLLIILPILAEFRLETGRNLVLRREKEIVAADSKTRGSLKFVGMHTLGPTDKKFVFVVKATKSSVAQAKRQCLLALKDMWDNNGGGIVYGFVTSGEHWQMIRYDGMAFTQTDRFQVMFSSMPHEKEIWMKEGSVIVDCIHLALRSGGFVAV
ncbi:hypothetical protein HOY80DRAFT_1098039 [Tuber brumale]|nr:hypothetical protein HOY80DRAFT_1098039 [Tuber brumale]